MTFYLSIGPCCLFLVDLLLRWHRSRMEVTLLDVKVLPAGNGAYVVKLDLYSPHFTWCPGDFVFLNIPEVSFLQWHPFTISGFSNVVNTFLGARYHENQCFSIHIRAMGENTFTNKVLAWAKNAPTLKALVCSMIKYHSIFYHRK